MTADSFRVSRLACPLCPTPGQAEESLRLCPPPRGTRGHWEQAPAWEGTPRRLGPGPREVRSSPPSPLLPFRSWPAPWGSISLLTTRAEHFTSHVLVRTCHLPQPPPNPGRGLAAQWAAGDGGCPHTPPVKVWAPRIQALHALMNRASIPPATGVLHALFPPPLTLSHELDPLSFRKTCLTPHSPGQRPWPPILIGLSTQRQQWDLWRLRVCQHECWVSLPSPVWLAAVTTGSSLAWHLTQRSARGQMSMCSSHSALE